MARFIIKQMKITKAKISNAYHEASHAVIALRLGLKDVRAYITDKEPDHGGRTGYYNPYRDNDPETEGHEYPEEIKKNIESEIMVCLAGALGQRKFNPKGFRKYHAENDWSKAADYALRLGIDNVVYLEDRTKEMINDPGIWADIEKVAKALIENEVLTDWQIKQLLNSPCN